MRRGRLALNSQFLQKRLEVILGFSSNVGANGSDLDACGGDVFHDEFPKLTPGQVTMRQAIVWHPTANAGDIVFRNTATKGGGVGHGHYSPYRAPPPLSRRCLGPPGVVGAHILQEGEKPRRRFLPRLLRGPACTLQNWTSPGSYVW